MKKGIIVLLITVLAAGMVFADFSGDAYIQFNADLDNKNYGFANGSDFSFSFKLDSEVAKVEGESPIHAVVEATANLIVAPKKGDKGATIYPTSLGYGVVFNLKTAKIVGENWSVAITGAKSAYDYAKASALTVKTKNVYDSFGNVAYKTYQSASYSVSYTKAPGITATYDGFTGSFGFNHKADTGTAFSATFETKEFAFSDDMVKVQAAAEVSKKADALTNVGVSAKAALAIEEVSVKLATDFGFEGIGKDQKATVQFDASLAAAYDFISATAYVFKGTELDTYTGLYLEATLGADLSKFDVPVAVSVYAMNLIDKSEAGIDLGASADYSNNAIAAGTSFDINTSSKAWSLNVYGIYAAEKFTAGANVAYAAKEVSFGAFAESSALIEGATIGVNYGLSNAYAMSYGGSYCVSNAVNTNSFGSDAKALGTAGAYCIINF